VHKAALSFVTDGSTGWIDIDLVANQKFMALFYKFLNVPVLQLAACQCLGQVSRIVLLKMFSFASDGLWSMMI